MPRFKKLHLYAQEHIRLKDSGCYCQNGIIMKPALLYRFLQNLLFINTGSFNFLSLLFAFKLLYHLECI